MRSAPLLLLATIVSAISARPAAADHVDRTSRTVSARAVQSLVVEATVGTVSITAWNRPDIAIDVERRAPDARALERLPVLIEESPTALRVSVRQTENGRDAALRGSVVLRVPATIVVERLALFEGDVMLVGLSGAVTVNVERGAIEGSALSGPLRLQTELGRIQLRATVLAPGGPLRLRTFNGNVSLEFARVPSAARILALSFNGRITSQIPLTMKDAFGPRFGETTIGAGEPLVSIDVVNGDIAIGVK